MRAASRSRKDQALSDSNGPWNGSAIEVPLCGTCTYGQIVQGFVESQQVTVCRRQYPPWPVPFPVRRCTGYLDCRQPDLEDMREVAHVLVRGQRGKQVGFVTPDRYREMQDENAD